MSFLQRWSRPSALERRSHSRQASASPQQQFVATFTDSVDALPQPAQSTASQLAGYTRLFVPPQPIIRQQFALGRFSLQISSELQMSGYNHNRYAVTSPPQIDRNSRPFTGQHYFAFGSNMSLEQMKTRGTTHDRILPAVLPAHALVFNKRSQTGREAFANIEPDTRENAVYGVLYMNCPPSAFAKLDQYEGVRDGHYVSRNITVYVPQSLLSSQEPLTRLPKKSPWYNSPQGFDLQKPVEPVEAIKAVTYVAGERFRISGGPNLLPTTRYKNRLLEGENWLPKRYFQWLKQTLTHD